MGVPKEVVTGPSHDLSLRVVRLERSASGHWTAVLDVRGTLQVGDGRALHLATVLRARTSNQDGRKPREQQCR